MPRGGARPGAGRKKKPQPTSAAAPAAVSELNSGEKRRGRKPGVPNKANRTLKEYADQYTVEAIDGLVAIARMRKAPVAARVSAWNAVLDRGHGRPPQSVGLADGKGGQMAARRVVIELDDRQPIAPHAQ